MCRTPHANLDYYVKALITGARIARATAYGTAVIIA
jgi:hypothetical protein